MIIGGMDYKQCDHQYCHDLCDHDANEGLKNCQQYCYFESKPIEIKDPKIREKMKKLDQLLITTPTKPLWEKV